MQINAQIISDDRGSERFIASLDATLRDRVTRPHDVMIEDLSLTGFRLSGGPKLNIGEQASIGFAGIGVQQVRVIRQDGNTYGCEFITPITQEKLSAALTAEPVSSIAFPAIGPLPFEPFVEPYSGRTKLAIATVAAVGGWIVATGLYFGLS